MRRRWLRTTAALGAATLAAGALGWGATTAVLWARYGRTRAPAPDAVLDALLPTYDVHERHERVVHAPPDTTFAALRAMDLQRSPVIRAIFGARERLLGAHPPAEATRPRGLVAETRALGWRPVHEGPRRLVMAAVTRPWEADVVFHGMDAAAFARFAEPGWVKIAWTLEAIPQPDGTTLARTETRVATTDAEARRRFRRYWAAFAPGIGLIRRVGLRLTAADATARVRTAGR